MSKIKIRNLMDEENRDRYIYFELWGIMLIILAIVILSELGAVGRLFAVFMKLLVGDWFWILEIYQIYYGIYLITRHRFPEYKSMKIIGIIMIYLSLLVYTHFPIYHYLISASSSKNIILGSWKLYMNYLNGTYPYDVYGGGIIGALLFQFLYVLLGVVGIYVITLIIFINGVAFFFEKSIIQFLNDIYKGINDLLDKMGKGINYSYSVMKEKTKEVSKINNIDDNEYEIDNEIDPEEHRFKTVGNNKSDTKNNDSATKRKSIFSNKIPPLTENNDKSAIKMQREISVTNRQLINKLLEENGIVASISEIAIGPTVTNYYINKKINVKAVKIMNLTNEIELLLKVSGIRFFYDHINHSQLVLQVPNKYKYSLYIGDLINSNKDKIDDDKYEILLGLTDEGKLFKLSLLNNNINIIYGNSNTGITNFLKSIIINILYLSKSKDNVIIFDSKFMQYKYFDQLKIVKNIFNNNNRDIADFKKLLDYEIDNRVRKLMTKDYQDVYEYNKENEPIPNLFLFIDTFNEDVYNLIKPDIPIYKKLGVYLFGVVGDTISIDPIKFLLPYTNTRIIFKNNNDSFSETFIGTKDYKLLLDNGDCLLALDGNDDTVRLQTALVMNNDVKKIIRM